MSRMLYTVLLMLALLQCSLVDAAPREYRFDPVHSRLVFLVDHLGFSRSIGSFGAWQGSFRFDPEDWSSASVDVRIDIRSLEMGDETWNRTLLGRRWFDAEQYPEARFVASGLQALAPDRGELRGELTLRGQTRPLVLAVQVNRIGLHRYTLKATAGFSARTTLRRSDYGMTALQGEVGEEIELIIEVEGQWDKPKDRPGKR